MRKILLYKIILPFLFLSFQIIFFSCQKEMSAPPPDVIAKTKDSTLLIKSIRITEDSEYVTEYYNYDSLNRKITLNWDSPSGIYPEGVSGIFSYNDKNLISAIDIKFPNGQAPDPYFIISTKIFYDGQNVLQKIELHEASGNTQTRFFTKQTLPANKYELSWKEPESILAVDGSWGDTVRRRAVFDDSSRLITSTSTYSYAVVLPDNIYTQIVSTDSFVYDTRGSLLKVVHNFKDTLRHTDTSIIRYEFLSRATKGDNLCNQRRALMNGIANIPFSDFFLKGQMGILFYFADEIGHFEYSKYPFQSAKIFRYSINQYETFNAVSEFDSKDRLVKFTGFFDDDTLFPQEYKITYYK